MIHTVKRVKIINYSNYSDIIYNKKNNGILLDDMRSKYVNNKDEDETFIVNIKSAYISKSGSISISKNPTYNMEVILEYDVIKPIINGVIKDYTPSINNKISKQKSFIHKCGNINAITGLSLDIGNNKAYNYSVIPNEIIPRNIEIFEKIIDSEYKLPIRLVTYKLKTGAINAVMGVGVVWMPYVSRYVYCINNINISKHEFDNLCLYYNLVVDEYDKLKEEELNDDIVEVLIASKPKPGTNVLTKLGEFIMSSSNAFKKENSTVQINLGKIGLTNLTDVEEIDNVDTIPVSNIKTLNRLLLDMYNNMIVYRFLKNPVILDVYKKINK